MILERVQHHLMITFIIALSLMYGLVFVATRAQIIDPPQLTATYIEPVQGVNIPGGSVFNIQATIGPNQGFTHVYFTLLGTITDLEFPAELQTDGSWRAISSWDTADYAAGEYYIKITAQTFDNNGLLVEEIASPLQTFILLGSRDPEIYDIGGDTTFLSPLTGMEITEDTMDIMLQSEEDAYLENVLFDIHEVDSNGSIVAPALIEDISGQQIDAVNSVWGVQGYDVSDLADGEYQIIAEAEFEPNGADGGTSSISNYVRFFISTVDDIPEVIIPLEIVDVFSPANTEDVLLGEVLLGFEINRPLDPNFRLTARIHNILDVHVGSVELFPANAEGTLIYSGYWDTRAVQEDETPLYRDAIYNIEVYDEGEGFSLSDPLIVLGPYTVGNLTEESEAEGIVSISPVPGSDLISNGILPIPIELELDFVATSVWMDFNHEDDDAISNGFFLTKAALSDYIWDAAFILNNTDDFFPSGTYDLILEIIKEDGTTYRDENDELPTYSYNLIVETIDDPDLPPPPPDDLDDVVLNFHNSESFMESEVTLMGSSNTDLSNSIVYFVFENQDNGVKYFFSATQVDWSQLESRGINRDNFPDADYAYIKDSVPFDGPPDLTTGIYDAWFQYSAEGNMYWEWVISNVLEDIEINNPDQEENNDEEEIIPEPEDEDAEPEDEEEDETTGPEDIPEQENETSDSGGSVAVNLYTSCIEAGISDEENCRLFRATIDSLADECIDQSIYDAVSCEDYLNRAHVDMECQGRGIVDINQCKDYLLESYGSGVDCFDDDINICNDILRNEYLNRLVVGQRQTTNVNNILNPLIGRVMTVGELNTTLNEGGIDEEIIPLTPLEEAGTNVYIAQSKSETVLEDSDKLTIINQAILMVDTDEDELSDDFEIYYDTDPNNPDTDGDGYLDGQEIKNGYDPLGPGRLEVIRNDLEQAIASGQSIEQPRLKSRKIDKNFDISNINSQDKNVKFGGKATANTWVTLFLYSDLPLVMTTKTDESGNWVYDIQHSLADGHHRVYVTVNDNTGKIIKQSNPTSFLVKSAQAVTADDYFDDISTQDSVNNMLIYYIIGAAFLIIIALVVIIFLHQRKREEIEA